MPDVCCIAANCTLSPTLTFNYICHKSQISLLFLTLLLSRLSVFQEPRRGRLLALSVPLDGATGLLVSGVDPKLVRFQLTPCLGPNSDWPVWVTASIKSQHTNDVRCLVHARDCIVALLVGFYNTCLCSP